MARRHWAEMSVPQRAFLFAASMAQFALLGAALWDIRRRDEALIRGPKRVWRGVVFINWIGPIAYFTLGRK
jgi:hypothetical protein